ncbi:MAG: HEAT repeat domain-containing protein, partial [Bacteroidales bacterium]|nr:HEAT repeat domain-containing protein [Bacteroidales bacterium]
MKKIFKSLVIVALLLVSFGVQAQPNQRKASTIVGDALAKFPAKDMKLYNELATELLGTGKEGMDLLYNMLEKQDESMVPVEFALSAITTKATEVGGETLQNVKEAFKGYADKTKDETIKQLFVRQLLFLGENYDGKNVTTSSELDPGTTPATKIKDLAKLIKKGNKKSIFDALYKVGDVAAAKDAIVKLLPALKSSDTKADLLWWLGEQKDKALSSVFKGYIDDADRRVRKEAAWALTKSGCGCALPTVAKMLTSADTADVAVAEKCLRSLPGKVADVAASYFDKSGEAGKEAILNLISQRQSITNKALVLGSLFDNSSAVSEAAFAALP